MRASAGWNIAGGAALAAAWAAGSPAAAPILAALAANHLSLVAAGLIPRAALLGRNVCRLDPRAAGRTVALTLDDGPDPAVTPAVLDLLDAHRARASFFCIGERAAAAPDVVREIVRRGHRVENHTYRHRKSFWFHPPRRLAEEIHRTQDTLGALAGAAPGWFRAPAGIRSPLLETALERAGLALVTWTRRGFDTNTLDAAAIAARLTAGLAHGDILLLHDGNSPRGAGGRAVILESLPRLLDTLAGAGMKAVPLPPPSASPS